MKVSGRCWRYIVMFVVVVILLVPSTSTFASDTNQDIPSPEPRPFGKTYGQWNAEWWQWLFSVPVPFNPGPAGSGPVDCRAGQSGDVWFLAGFLSASQQGGTFTRTCDIPAGKALVVPTINSWADNTCFLPTRFTVPQLRDLAAGLVPSSTEDVFITVDGRSLDPQRAISPVFHYKLPLENNVLTEVFNAEIPGSCWPSLTVAPVVADGYYVVIPPLAPGEHVIRFGGTAPNGFILDMTYIITVV